MKKKWSNEKEVKFSKRTLPAFASFSMLMSPQPASTLGAAAAAT